MRRLDRGLPLGRTAWRIELDRIEVRIAGRHEVWANPEQWAQIAGAEAMKASEAYDEAMRRIEDAFEEDAYSLDLGDLPLRELPADVSSVFE